MEKVNFMVLEVHLSVANQRMSLPLLDEFKMLQKNLVFQKQMILIQEIIMVVVIFK